MIVHMLIFSAFLKGFSTSIIDTLLTSNKEISVFQSATKDSFFTEIHGDFTPLKYRSLNIDSLQHTLLDSISKFEQLTSKVVISITNDTLQLKNIDSLLKLELQRKNLNLNYGLTFKEPYFPKQTFNKSAINTNALQTTSRSTFLPEPSLLTVYFSNETKIILKRILSGILISTLLVLAVISCLVYMLNIINRQKQLAEVKNDLISNITHEFKTPIATISVALESIKNFNVINDKAKTESYLDLSSNQLSKLTVMVEKLLETATLDSDSLELNKEPVDLVDLLSLLVDKHKIQLKDKSLSFNASEEAIVTQIDIFHFENAVNNIIDNAIKYGGDTIEVDVYDKDRSIEIAISDTGNTLTQANVNQIFEKFYRVSKGNTHDVKGFGIGLYYTKKIVEKHHGTITVHLKEQTTFKITLPKA